MSGFRALLGPASSYFYCSGSITGSASIAFLTASLYRLNPNVVYMSLTPMDEPSLILFVTFAGYALYRWLTNDSLLWLFLCAAAVMLATLCRYEAWPLAVFVVLPGFRRRFPDGVSRKDRKQFGSSR